MTARLLLRASAFHEGEQLSRSVCRYNPRARPLRANGTQDSFCGNRDGFRGRWPTGGTCRTHDVRESDGQRASGCGLDGGCRGRGRGTPLPEAFWVIGRARRSLGANRRFLAFLQLPLIRARNRLRGRRKGARFRSSLVFGRDQDAFYATHRPGGLVRRPSDGSGPHAQIRLQDAGRARPGAGTTTFGATAVAWAPAGHNQPSVSPAPPGSASDANPRPTYGPRAPITEWYAEPDRLALEAGFRKRPAAPAATAAFG